MTLCDKLMLTKSFLFCDWRTNVLNLKKWLTRALVVGVIMAFVMCPQRNEDVRWSASIRKHPIHVEKWMRNENKIFGTYESSQLSVGKLWSWIQRCLKEESDAVILDVLHFIQWPYVTRKKFYSENDYIRFDFIKFFQAYSWIFTAIITFEH
jgi:hypothetical protein